MREDRYPGYDVLAKRNTPSWNAKTREVIDARLAVLREPRFFTAEEYATVEALAARIVPSPSGRAPLPIAALVDQKLAAGLSDGYRNAGMPREREAWRQGLRALDAEARRAHGGAFRDISADEQDHLLKKMQEGALHDPSWGSMSPRTFFERRMARDVVFACFAHPDSWSRIGFGGPASPRGYVRLDFDERDSWEAAEVKDGNVAAARRRNRRVG